MSRVSPAIRSLCTERDAEACVRCPKGRTRPAQQLHHRRPRGMGSSVRGSTNQPSNLISLCEPCHREVESDRSAAFTQGYLVRQGEEPSTVPVLYRGQHVLLSDAGAIVETQLL